MSSFTRCPPLLAIPPDYKLFKVQIDFEYRIGKEDRLAVIKIHKGFITDGASIPQFAWSIIGGPLGKYGPAAVVHDFAYKYKLYSRKVCDKIFLEAMKVLCVSIWKRYTMYWAVRGFAWIGWRMHRKREEVN